MVDFIDVVLADDHLLVRQGIRELLRTEGDIRVVGEAGTGVETCRLVEDLNPHILLADLRMPDLNGLVVTAKIVQRRARTRVIILTMYNDEAHILEALKNGASGYVLKDSSAAELIHAIREVAQGGRYLSPALSQRAMEAYLDESKRPKGDSYQNLTTREREVLHLVAEGNTNSQVARQLSISPRTVEVHRAKMMQKLGLKSHTELIRFAIAHGIVPAKP